MSRFLKAFVLVVVLVTGLSASGLGLSGAQEPKVLRTAYLPGDVILDPAHATWVNEVQIINEIFPGLTTLNELTVETEPGVAKDWTVSDDGLTYTFHLMDNVPWVKYDADQGQVVQIMDESGNPRMVTANDVVYSMNREFAADTGSEYASTLAPWVVNAAEMMAGQDVQIGVTAVDDYTLEIKSPKAAGYLPMMYGLWMSRPEPQWAIEEFGDAWTEAGTMPTYGPYTLKTWEHDVEVTLIKNPFWPATDAIPQAKIDEWVFTYLDEPAMLAAYEAGELDWIPTIPLPDIDRLRTEYPDELAIGPDTCTYYYGFNVLVPPTDNVHMRRALSLAIDRATVVQITNGGQVPAGYFTRPDVAPLVKQEDYPGTGIMSDPEAAKAELQAYFDETGTTLADLPPITLMHNTSTTHATIAQAIQQMWKETLGVDVQITSQDAQVYNETLRRDAPPIWRLGWCYDYPDAASFVNDVFRSKGPDSNNHTNWGSDEFYKLVDEAGVATDPQVRRDLYAQAEDILVNKEAAIAPIYYYTSQQMTKPNVIRTFAVNRSERLEKWDLQ